MNNNFITNNSEQDDNEDKYDEIMDILNGESIEDIQNKAELFDKYGMKNFKKFVNNSCKDIYDETLNNKNLFENLVNYRKYVNSLKFKKEYGYLKQNDSNQNVYNKLISVTSDTDIHNIISKINLKIQENKDNKQFLQKVKNILKQQVINY